MNSTAATPHCTLALCIPRDVLAQNAVRFLYWNVRETVNGSVWPQRLALGPAITLTVRAMQPVAATVPLTASRANRL